MQSTVKSSINQSDNSGETLDNFVATGTTFVEIIQILNDKYSPRAKGRAVIANGACLFAAFPSLSAAEALPCYFTQQASHATILTSAFSWGICFGGCSDSWIQNPEIILISYNTFFFNQSHYALLLF